MSIPLDRQLLVLSIQGAPGRHGYLDRSFRLQRLSNLHSRHHRNTPQPNASLPMTKTVQMIQTTLRARTLTRTMGIPMMEQRNIWKA